MVNYHGGSLVVTSTRELKTMKKLFLRRMATDIDGYHEEHECARWMTEKKPPRPTPRASGRLKQLAAPKKQGQRVKPSSTIESRDNLPRMGFWSMVVPHGAEDSASARRLRRARQDRSAHTPAGRRRVEMGTECLGPGASFSARGHRH